MAKQGLDRAPLIDPPSFSVGRLTEDLITHDGWSRDRLLTHQRTSLDSLLDHAVARSPYYRTRIGPLRARGVPFEELPTLTKPALVADLDKIVTDRRLSLATIESFLDHGDRTDLLLDEYRVCATGGTTGLRALMAYDRLAWAYAIANGARFMAALGVTSTSRMALIGSPQPLHLSHRLLGAMREARPDLPELDVTMPLADLVAALNAYAPEVLVTYASLLRQLMEEQREGRLRIAPRIVGSNAEVLTDDIRKLCGRVWRVTVLDRYATTEIGMTGVECLQATGIHLPEDLIVFEAVDAANRPVPAGTAGARLLVTTLVNRAMPLIRYELSDRVTLDPSPCACGRPYVRMVKIDGRQEECLRLPSRHGGTVEIHALRLQPALIGLPGVRQFQIVPLERGLEVRLVLRDGSDADALKARAERELAALLAAHGAIVEPLRVVVVERIERVGTGAKLRLVAPN